MAKTIDEKVNTVLTQNTFWFQDRVFEEKYEAHITVLKETLLVLRNEIQNQGLTKKLVEDLLLKNTNGLKVLLALTGLSNESFKRLVSFIRVVDDVELSQLSYRNQWLEVTELDNHDITEWSDLKIESKIQESVYFRKGIVNLFYEGSTIPLLSKTLPLFELKKLSFSKLNFDVEAMIDTLIRYKEKGSYSGQMKNNPEVIIGKLLEDMEISFENGDLNKLKEHAPTEKRTMDFIIPNQENPQIIIESSYLTTTSSGQGDKAKTENHIRRLLKEHYPNVRFWGFVDGIGWYVRKNDLRRMVVAFEDVFTLEESELIRFQQTLIAVLK